MFKNKPLVIVYFFYFLLVSISVGCSEEENDLVVIVGEEENLPVENTQDPNTPDSTEVNPQEQSQIQMMLGIRGGAQVQGLAEEMTSIMADSVLFASQSVGTGQVITSGTITQQGQNLVYNGTPNDRLILRLTETPEITIYISQLNGDLSSIQSLVQNDHLIDFRVEAETFNLTVNSAQNGVDRTGSLNGSVMLNNVTYQIQVQRTERVVAGVDFGAAEHESEAQTIGSITSDSQFRVNLNESYRYKFIIFDNAVQNITFTSNNTWSSQGNNYALSNAMIRYETLNGWPNPTDYWVAQGQLTQNGQLIGEIGMEQKPLWIEVFLQMADGERIEIDRHILQSGN